MFSNINDISNVYQEIPNVYKADGVVYRNYSKHTHLHEAHWRRVVELPTITVYQKYWQWVAGDVITREVIDMTEQEVTEYQDSLIPLTVSPRAFRLALIQSWISMSSITSVIDAIEDASQREIVDTMREYSLEVNRKDPILLQFAWQLGMTQDDINSIFIAIWSQEI